MCLHLVFSYNNRVAIRSKTMNIKLSIFTDNKTYDGAIKHVQKEVEFNLDNTDELNSLKYYLGNSIHSPYTWNSNGRDEKNFLRADAMFLDFDDGFDLDLWKQSIFSRFNQIIYCSKSHQLLKKGVIGDRFHVLLMLNEEDKTNGKKIYDMLSKIRNLIFGMGHKLDKCIDIARLIFPSRNSGDTNVNPHFDSTFQIIDNKINISDEIIDNLFVEQGIENGFIDDLQVKKIETKVDYNYNFGDYNKEYNIHKAVEYLMGFELDHEQRFAIACGLWNHYQSDEGKKLLLSIKNSEGTIRCWNSAKNKAYEQITLGSLFGIAMEYGFKYYTYEDVINEELEQKYKDQFNLLEMQRENRKKNEIEKLNEEKSKIMENKKEESKKIVTQTSNVINEILSNDEYTENEKEDKIKAMDTERKSRIERVTKETEKSLKEIDKTLNTIDKEIDKDIDREIKELERKQNEEKKQKQRELKRSKTQENNRIKNELITNGVGDLRRFVGEEYTKIWEDAIKIHPECKIFMAQNGSGLKLIKFTDKGDNGSVSILKGLEWSGICETVTNHTYKITSGIYDGNGKPVVDSDFDSMNFNFTKRITNNEFDKYDEYYLRGIVKIQLLPNLTEIYNENDEFETMMNTIYGDYTEFLLNFLSMVAFEDRKNARPCVAITGDRGSGKSLFISIMRYLFPNSTSDYNNSDFNTYAIDKIIAVDEVYSNRKNLWDKIKTITGSKFIDVIFKGKNPIHCDSISYFVMASNSRPIKITETPISSADNQVYAVKLLTPFSKNQNANFFYGKKRKSMDDDISIFLCNRIGHWLRTKGLERFQTLVEKRKHKTLRYGLEVPITKTLMQWCQSGYEDKYQEILKLTADLISQNGSDLLKAIQQGFISKSFWKNANIDDIKIYEFFKNLKETFIIEDESSLFKFNNQMVTGFKIRKKFQLLLWLNSFLDETDAIKKMLSQYVTPIDSEHITIDVDKDIDIQAFDKSLFDEKDLIDEKDFTKVSDNNIQPIEVSQSVFTEITDKTQDVIQAVTPPCEIPIEYQYLFNLTDKTSLNNIGNDINFNDIDDISQISRKPKDEYLLSPSEFDEMIDKSRMYNMETNFRYDLSDMNFNITPEVFILINNSLYNKTNEKVISFFDGINKLNPKRSWKQVLTPEELKKCDTKILFYLRKTLEELQTNKGVIPELQRTSDYFDFISRVKKSNIYMLLENIKQKFNFLPILLDEFEFNINYNKDLLFLVLYYLLN